MSLCHPDDGRVSCGSCCGLFNLKLDTIGYKNLLSERTKSFQDSVDYSIRHTIASYRQSRELIENSIPKQDDMTYNCPYLGYVDDTDSKIGCMIHPIFTGDPKSQNFSFYGTSICQAYDCKNKEHASAELLETFFQRIAKDSIEFSHLASDHVFVFVIESWLSLKGWSLSEGLEVFSVLLNGIFQARLAAKEKIFPTSFEIRYSSFASELEIYEYLDDVLSEDRKEEILTQMKKAPARE